MDLVDILLEVIERNASDLHISVGSPPLLRIHGRLQRMDLPLVDANQARELVYSILTQEQRQRLENELEIDFSYSVPGRARFRVTPTSTQQSGRRFVSPVEIKSWRPSSPRSCTFSSCRAACDRHGLRSASRPPWRPHR